MRVPHFRVLGRSLWYLVLPLKTYDHLAERAVLTAPSLTDKDMDALGVTLEWPMLQRSSIIHTTQLSWLTHCRPVIIRHRCIAPLQNLSGMTVPEITTRVHTLTHTLSVIVNETNEWMNHGKLARQSFIHTTRSYKQHNRPAYNGFFVAPGITPTSLYVIEWTPTAQIRRQHFAFTNMYYTIPQNWPPQSAVTLASC